MNKQNKLARNAIRARKAQKKRANEQDKPKRGKRWITRLFALVGCLLLVFALALPCFADITYVPSDSEFDTAFEDFISDYMLEAYRELRAYLPDTFYFQRYFNAITIYSNDQRLPFVLGSDLNYTFSTENIDVDYYIYVNYNNSGGSVFNCYFTYSFVTDRGDDSFDLTLICYSRDNDSVIFEAYYTGTTNSGTSYGNYIDCSINRLTSPLFNNGGMLDYQYFYIGLVGAQLPYSMAMVTNLLFFNSIAVNPNDWYEGAMGLAEGSYNQGYTDGREDGYDEGYDEGYDAGHDAGFDEGEAAGLVAGYQRGRSDGYEEGYDMGVKKGESNISGVYQQGYDQAVSEIDSGEFGRNFLSGVFTAPLDALHDFAIVQWNTSDGTTITINLMTILSGIVGLSLFVWFLKMFAGG